MGYACPVCDSPQRDGEHLANHLAFAAMLHGGDHEAWLADHAPDWGEDAPADLAERVVPHADAVEYEAVFEDTLQDRTRGRGRPAVDPGAADVPGAPDVPDAPVDEETREIVREARRLTEEMRDDE